MKSAGPPGVAGDQVRRRITGVASYRRPVVPMLAALLVILLGAAMALSGSMSPVPPPGAAGGRQPTVPGVPPSTPGGFAGRTITIIGGGDVLLHPSVWAQAASDAAAAGRVRLRAALRTGRT